jgi:putrescine transport system permease protein
MYPKWLWPVFAVPRVVWLIPLFLVPFYAVIGVASGGIDSIVQNPI